MGVSLHLECTIFIIAFFPPSNFPLKFLNWISQKELVHADDIEIYVIAGENKNPIGPCQKVRTFLFSFLFQAINCV
jgi:hypothetical protein